MSLHDAVGYVAERCECDLIKAGKAILAALGEGALVASAKVLVSDRGYLPAIVDGPIPLGPPRRVYAGIEPVPPKVWAGYPGSWFERRAVLPRGNAQYREHTAEGKDIGPVFVDPTLATADIDSWLNREGHKDSADTIRKGRRGPQAGTLDRYGVADRMLFPELERISRDCNLSLTQAALQLAEGRIEGKVVAGNGSPLSKAKRLVGLYKREHGAGQQKPPETL
jgi:hypothetical protein